MGALNLLAKSAKVAEANRALPLRLARAAPKTQAEIDALATRVAKQMNNEHVVSGKPKDTKNLAGRSMKENKRLSGLEYLVEPTGAARESVIYQPRKGDVNVAIPGDQTISDSILRSVGDIEGINSHQQGGSRYGLGKMDLEEPIFWASGESAAQNAQNKFNDVGEFFDPERVVGQHMAMGPISNNFAMHFADANLRAIDWSKAKPNNVNVFDSIIAYGYKDPKTGERVKFPNWPGLADHEGALAAMKEDSNLRKWFNNRMKTPDVTQPLGLPNGLDIQWAITEPQLRNMEINLTGLSAGEMVPGAELTDTAAHNTYDKGIRGLALGHQEVLTPFTLSYPDAAQHIASTKNPSDFTGTIQKVFPHQIVDDQWLDEVGKYRELIKKYTGQKEGGEIHMSNFEKRIRGVKDEDGKASIRKIMAMMAGMMGQPTDIASQTFKGRDYKTKKNPNPTTPTLPKFTLKGRQYAKGGVTESQPTRFGRGGGASQSGKDKPLSEVFTQGLGPMLYGAARGTAAGLTGVPGDLEELARMGINFSFGPGGVKVDEKAALPTTEDMLKKIPSLKDFGAGKAAQHSEDIASKAGAYGVAQMAAPKVGKVVTQGAKALGKDLGELAAHKIATGQPLIPGVPKSLTNPPVMNIIKPEGGNWKPDNIERSLRRLKAPVNPDELLKNLDYIRENGVGYASREAALQDENLNRNYQNLLRDKALDQWVDKNLTNYVKKQMGSEKDPVRLLADQGITHYADEGAMRRALNTSYDQYARNRKVRKHWGMPEEHIANTSMGRAWEEGVDDLMGMHNMKRARDYGNEFIRAKNPWMEKLDPESILYGIDDQVPSNLQLNHIMDVLKEDLATGRMTAEDLKNVSMDRAVRRTHEYNQERAKAMEEAQAKKLEGMTVHKEYPEGFKWVQLNKPGQFAAESDAMGHSVRGYEPPRDHPDYVLNSGNAGSESYGLGGWDAIKRGDAKIYSLIDKIGRPHTTIEVGKGNNAQAFYDAHKNYLSHPIISRELSMMVDPDLDIPLNTQRITAMKKLLDEAGIPHGDVPQVPELINQIKGKQNRSPSPQYLPYVQDFIKSGKWSQINDLENANMYEHSGKYFTEPELIEAAKKYGRMGVQDVPWDVARQRHMESGIPEDKALENWIEAFKEGRGKLEFPPESQKRGGEIKMGVGGLLKNAIKGAKTIQKIEAPSVIIPSKINNIKKAVLKSKGDYGARRVERAADEIPNLDKLYKEEALKQAFLGDNAKAMMTMNPEDFEKYAAPLEPRFMDANSTRYTTSGEQLTYPEYMSEYLPNVGAFNDLPFLEINKKIQGLSIPPFISGHEGRHRNRTLAAKGENTGLVQLLPRARLREPFPRHSQEEYIEALKKELEITNNLVEPQAYWNPDVLSSEPQIKRPAINLPDIYAKGGAVQSLESNLFKLPKTDYDSIDELMTEISKLHKTVPKKLHDEFVAKHHMTPDTWIKRK
jgi:hypothetical protein